MANRPKSPMPIAERAKQFLPFAAVKGLPEALAKKEKVTEKKVEMTEALAMALDEKIRCIHKGDRVTVTYYDRDAYVKFTGAVDHIDPIFRTLQIEAVQIEIDGIRDIIMLE